MCNIHHRGEEELNIIKEAIEDHRASAKDEPRSIYGRYALFR